MCRGNFIRWPSKEQRSDGELVYYSGLAPDGSANSASPQASHRENHPPAGASSVHVSSPFSASLSPQSPEKTSILTSPLQDALNSLSTRPEDAHFSGGEQLFPSLQHVGATSTHAQALAAQQYQLPSAGEGRPREVVGALAKEASGAMHTRTQSLSIDVGHKSVTNSEEVMGIPAPFWRSDAGFDGELRARQMFQDVTPPLPTTIPAHAFGTVERS